jgi:hypothetical protein
VKKVVCADMILKISRKKIKKSALFRKVIIYDLFSNLEKNQMMLLKRKAIYLES